MMGLGVGIDYALFVVTRYRQHLARAGARGCGGGLAEHRRPGGAHRRGDRRDLPPRPVPHGTALHDRRLRRRHRRRAGRPPGLAHTAPGAARLRRPGDRTALGPALGAVPSPGPPGFLVPLEPDDPASSLAGAIGAVIVLVVLAVPMFSMRLAFSDAGNDPASLTTRQAYDLLSGGSGPASTGRWWSPSPCRGPGAPGRRAAWRRGSRGLRASQVAPPYASTRGQRRGHRRHPDQRTPGGGDPSLVFSCGRRSSPVLSRPGSAGGRRGDRVGHRRRRLPLGPPAPG